MLFLATAAIAALVACAVVGSTAARAVRLMHPARAVVVISVAAFSTSLAAGIALSAIAVAALAGLTAVAGRGEWSAIALRAALPVPYWFGGLAAAIVLILLLRAVARTVGIAVELIRAERLCRDLRNGGPIVIVDDASADAYTIAGVRGCIVISQRLFDALDDAQRRVLTAHELSHLHRRHHLYIHLVDLAATANPLVRPATRAIRFAVERWADEDAAAALGDRRRTGRALAEIALLRSRLTTASTTSPRRVAAAVPQLGVATHHVVNRVQALFGPPRHSNRGATALAVLAAALILLLGIASLWHVGEVIQDATILLPRLHLHER